MKNVLIAGGAGFIGSHLCDRLIEDGERVICVDNLITGSRSNIEHLLENESFTFIEHDIINPLEVKESLDFVFDLASPASPVDYMNHPIETLLVGSAGTKNTLDMAREKNAGFLFTSTSEVYGDPLVHPQTESYWGNVNSVGPRSMYDEAKRYAEALTMAYHCTYGVDTRIIRIFNTYGPRMKVNDGRVVPNFISQALHTDPLTVYGDGKQTRSFCYISDMIDGLLALAESGIHEPVNVGNPTELNMLDLAEKIVELTGSKSELTFKPLPVDDPRTRQPDISKAKDLIGWWPKVSLDEGLGLTVAWFKENM